MRVTKHHNFPALFLTVVIVILVLLPLIVFLVSRTSTSATNSINRFLQAVHLGKLQSPGSLTTKEYIEINSKLKSIVINQSPKEALIYLSGQMDKNPMVLKECHGFVHSIGNEAYNIYKDFVTIVSYQDDLCGSGYIHGAVEAYFMNTPNVSEAIQTVCSNYELSNISRKCYHGVGHGLMYYTGNNLPLSVQLCSGYDDPIARIRCSEGVYMENFGTFRALHPSKYISLSDPLYPCSQQPDDFKVACYYYAPLFYLSLYDEDYTGALQLCEKAEGEYALVCAKGVGSRIIKQHIDEPRFAEKACMSNKKEQISSCIDGIVSYHLVNYESLEKARAMCAALSIINQSHCLDSVEQQKDLASN